MQIAIDVNDTTIADKILDYLKSFKKDVKIETYDEDSLLKSYQNSKQFTKDRELLHSRLDEYKNNHSSFTEITDNFWLDTEKRLIERHQKKVI